MTSDAGVAAAAFFSELVDAVRYAKGWAESLDKQVEVRKAFERELDTLEEIQSKVSSLFETKMIETDVKEPMAKAVNEFVGVAVQQARSKLEAKQKKAIQVVSSETDSFKSKSIKSLESFLAVSPLPILDEEISLDLSGSSYAANAKFKCTGEIEYEFLLNTANSELFVSALASSSVWKGLRIPVRLGKSWVKKEPVPDYERLDSYVMVGVRASENHLNMKLIDQATSAAVTIVFSRSSTDAFVTVEYSDKTGRVDVTGEPSLNRYLDLTSIKKMVERVLDTISALDGEKLKLTRLECAGENIIASLDCFGFMQRVALVFFQSSEYIQAVRAIDARAALDRLALLGENSRAISDSLGIEELPASPLPKTR